MSKILELQEILRAVGREAECLVSTNKIRADQIKALVERGLDLAHPGELYGVGLQEQLTEDALCIQANFENLKKMVPALCLVPFAQVVELQINTLLEHLGHSD